MQIESIRSPGTGLTVAETIAQFPAELDLDAVGVWQIVPAGVVDFGFEGHELSQFLRLAIYSLLDAGAVPVFHEANSGYEWARQTKYGTTREDIADAIVREWEPIPKTSEAMISHCPWFAKPDPELPKYIKMD